MKLTFSCLYALVLTYSFIFGAKEVQAQFPPLSNKTSPNQKAEVNSADNVNLQLSTPRKTIEYFYKYMESYAAGEESSLQIAMKSMDLSEIPEFSREEQGRNLAIKLHAILVRTEIDLKKIEGSPATGEYVIKADDKVQIVLTENQSNWMFSAATIRHIPELYSNIKDEKVLKSTAVEIPVMMNIINLRKYVPKILTGQIFYVEYWQILGVLLALLSAVLFKYFLVYCFKILSNLFVNKIEALSNIDTLNSLFLPMTYILSTYLLHLELHLLDLDPVVYTSLLRMLEIVKIAALFILFVKAVDLAAEVLLVRPRKIFGGSDRILIPLATTTLKFLLFFIGIVSVAALFSINVTGLLAGLGIGGLALALAAKDTVENLFGSITVLIDKPFKVGDFISIEGVSGSVEQIGLRSTRLRTPENSLLTIPNSKLISVIVDNLGARKFFRTRHVIGVTYETSLENLQVFCESIRELLKNHPKARNDYFVHFNEFASSSLNILIQVSFQVSSYADFLAKQEDFFMNIIKIANHLGVEFAYPVEKQIISESQDVIEESASIDKESLKSFLKELSKKGS